MKSRLLAVATGLALATVAGTAAAEKEEPVEIRAVIDISVKGRDCRLRESTTETLPTVGQRVHLWIYCPGRLSTGWLDTDLVKAAE